MGTLIVGVILGLIVFADVGVLILAVLNATRTLRINEE